VSPIDESLFSESPIWKLLEKPALRKNARNRDPVARALGHKKQTQQKVDEITCHDNFNDQSFLSIILTLT